MPKWRHDVLFHDVAHAASVHGLMNVAGTYTGPFVIDVLASPLFIFVLSSTPVRIKVVGVTSHGPGGGGAARRTMQRWLQLHMVPRSRRLHCRSYQSSWRHTPLGGGVHVAMFKHAVHAPQPCPQPSVALTFVSK